MTKYNEFNNLQEELKDATYIGDAVYASFDGYQVWLKTTNGLSITNRIALPPAQLSVLFSMYDKICSDNKKEEEMTPYQKNLERVTNAKGIEKYKLESHGVRHALLCPWHIEKTPSLSIEMEKGYFHCFGCQKHGTIDELIAHIEYSNDLESKLKFNIEDLLVECSSIGLFGKKNKLKITHKPTGIFIESEFYHQLDREQIKRDMLIDLSVRVESHTKLTKLSNRIKEHIDEHQ